jgi:methylated-DNA-[protein]-cysteine S-methyltransferase
MPGDVAVAKIYIGEARFGVVVGPRGVKKVVLPPLTEGIRRLAGAPALEPVVEVEEWGVRADGLLAQVGDFLAATLGALEPAAVPGADLSGLTGFTRRILCAVGRVPRGTVSSYSDVAWAEGAGSAARAVGNAVARNPVPLVIPCHRVVRADGSIGGWSGPAGWKEWLLELESSDGHGE